MPDGKCLGPGSAEQRESAAPRPGHAIASTLQKPARSDVGQLRDRRAVVIPARATGLRLDWNRDSDHPRTVAVSRANPGDYPFGYGFRVGLEVAID